MPLKQVFPGGNYDAAQDDSYQMTAIRETFEESGVLLASSRTQTTLLSDAVVDSSRKSIHAQQMLFRDFLKEHNLETDRKSLLPFTEWVTPPQVPRDVLHFQSASLTFMLFAADSTHVFT